MPVVTKAETVKRTVYAVERQNKRLCLHFVTPGIAR